MKAKYTRNKVSLRLFGKKFKDISLREAMFVNTARRTGIKSIVKRGKKFYE